MKALLVAMSIGLAFSITGCESYSVHSFRSDDAVIMYCGYWSTPRYRIPFDVLIVNGTESTATYEFVNPPDDTGLWIALNFIEDDDLATLLAVGSRAKVRIVDAESHVVLEFEGPLCDNTLLGEGWWPKAMVAMVPPTREYFRALGQVLKRNRTSKDGQPRSDEWGYNRDAEVLIAWGAWVELAKGSYSITFTITTSEPPSRPVRLLPMLTGGSRGVL